MSTFLKKCNEKKYGPVKVTAVITIISLPLQIAMVAMGAIYKDNCPAEKYIPIYLIVAGTVYIIVSIVYLVVQIFSDSDGKVWLSCQIVSGVICLFLFAWFIAGNVWIYGLHNKYNPTDKTAANYCDNTFYLFAFWCTTASYILIGVCILICCFMCFTSRLWIEAICYK